MQQVRSGATLPGVVTLVFNSRGHGVLPHLHDGHQGVDKTKDSAARPVCWPGLELSLDTDQMVKTCPECSEYRKATVGPMRARPFPDRPWSRIAPYFLHHDGKLFLPLTATQETLKSPWTPASCQRLKLFPEWRKCSVATVLQILLWQTTGPSLKLNKSPTLRRQGNWSMWHIQLTTFKPTAKSKVQFRRSRASQRRGTMSTLVSWCTATHHNGYCPAQLSMRRRLRTRIHYDPVTFLLNIPAVTTAKKTIV